MMNPSNLLGMLNSLMSNPLSLLTQRGFNLPQNLNDPQAIVQHLLNSGQISQDQVNQAMQMRNNPMFAGLFGKK